MRLQEKLDAFTDKLIGSGKFPAAVLEILHRSTEELIATGQAGRALKAGDTAPDFTLPDPDGKAVSSRQLLAKGPLVVTFYRGVWCPYCNLDLQALEETRSEIEARGASLVAISMQTAPNSRKSERDNNLGFPILTDFKGELAEKFGLRWQLSEEMVNFYKNMASIDLSKVNGEESWTLPMPARYVIGRDGVIAYAEVNPDYTKRPDPSDLFPVLDSLASARAGA
ncbi:MAG: AhpC/TSA family protein [Rhizobiaceae bacterium]|nr:AhpC/TSA family protein [Rhizobiaceae bacterium]